ncbi:MAG TPA: hypothetical protein PL009_04180 [Flavipsychrobacter sp.]|nr:hypothetical protein [Flavipsychrobacter sp.]
MRRIKSVTNYQITWDLQDIKGTMWQNKAYFDNDMYVGAVYNAKTLLSIED